MSDWVCTSTADFDAGTKSSTATVTDILNITANQIQLNVDGVDDAEITITTTNATTAVIGWSPTIPIKTSQSFTTVGACYLASVSTWVKSITSNPGNWVAYLYSDNAGVPGSLLATSNEKTQAGTTTGALNNLAFPKPYALAASTKYHIVFDTVSAPASSAYILGAQTPSVYAGGNLCQYFSGAWSGYGGIYDLTLTVFSQDVATSGNWKSATQSKPAGKTLSEFIGTHSGLTATYTCQYKILASNGSTVLYTGAVLTSGTSVTLTESDFGVITQDVIIQALFGSDAAAVAVQAVAQVEGSWAVAGAPQLMRSDNFNRLMR